MPKWKHPRRLREALAEYISIKSGCTHDERAISYALSKEGREMRNVFVSRISHRSKPSHERLLAAIAELDAKKE